jgi:hypothetical protein
VAGHMTPPTWKTKWQQIGQRRTPLREFASMNVFCCMWWSSPGHQPFTSDSLL